MEELLLAWCCFRAQPLSETGPAVLINASFDWDWLSRGPGSPSPHLHKAGAQTLLAQATCVELVQETSETVPP